MARIFNDARLVERLNVSFECPHASFPVNCRILLERLDAVPARIEKARGD
jgi:hypothetical protein